jgi:hypothetical protein
MSRLWLITCDRCGAESQPNVSRAEALREAQRNGWHVGLERDICPDCWGV